MQNKPTHQDPWREAHENSSCASQCAVCTLWEMTYWMYYLDLGERFDEGDPKIHPFQGQPYDSLVCEHCYILFTSDALLEG